MPLLLPAGSAHHLKKDEQGGFSLMSSTDVKLYVGADEDFSESRLATCTCGEPNGTVNHAVFTDVGRWGAVGKVRFDPFESGLITVSHLTIRAMLADGTEREISQDEYICSGFILEDGRVVFLHADPKIVMEFEHPLDIEMLSIDFSLYRGVVDADLDAALEQEHRRRELRDAAAVQARADAQPHKRRRLFS